ncbi:hypothetical protein CANARDRAFT_197623, partial [[Candida] arabinofermentans NRRL YB-2248]
SDASKAAVDFFNAVENKPEDNNKMFDMIAPMLNEQVLEEKKDEKKKVKKIKDPNAPRKPLTSFFLYSNAMRDVIVKERALTGESILSQPEIAQETSRRWKDLSDFEKLKWKELYEEQKVMYEEENKKYLLAKETGQPYTPPKRPDVAPTPASAKKSDHEPKKKDKKKKKKDRVPE